MGSNEFSTTAMPAVGLTVEAVAAILVGLLQVIIGIMSFWQQRQLRQAYRTSIEAHTWSG